MAAITFEEMINASTVMTPEEKAEALADAPAPRQFDFTDELQKSDTDLYRIWTTSQILNDIAELAIEQAGCVQSFDDAFCIFCVSRLATGMDLEEIAQEWLDYQIQHNGLSLIQ